MYPYEIIFGLTLYDILIAAGVAAAILLFSYLADKRGIKKKLQSLVMACWRADGFLRCLRKVFTTIWKRAFSPGAA